METKNSSYETAQQIRAERDWLRAENAELRAALEELAGPPGRYNGWEATAKAMRQRARAALAKGGAS